MANVIEELKQILGEAEHDAEPNGANGKNGEVANGKSAAGSAVGTKEFDKSADAGDAVTEPEEIDKGRKPAKRMLNKSGLGAVKRASRAAVSIIADVFDELGMEDNGTLKKELEGEVSEFLATLVVSR